MSSLIHIKIYKLILVILIVFFSSLYGQDTLDHIRITYIPGGSEVGNYTMCLDESITLYASCYDAENNYIGNVDAVWSSIGTLDSVSHTGSSFIFSPVTGNTSGMIVASYDGFSDTTGHITVCGNGILRRLIIRTAPNGTGEEFGDYTMTADESVTLYAAGYDAGDNYISDVNVSWASTGTLDAINATGESYTFNPIKAPASGNIVATSGGDFTDQTGTITVSPGGVCYIRITSEPDTMFLSVGQRLSIGVSGYDCNGNYIELVSVDYSTIDGLDFDHPSCGRIVVTFNMCSDTSGIICVVENSTNIQPEELIPSQFKLETNAPNPFNNSTQISFQLPTTTQVTLTIYDIAGMKVKELVSNRIYTPGRYSIVWDASGQGSGIYFYEIRMEYDRAVKKMLLVK